MASGDELSRLYFTIFLFNKSLISYCFNIIGDNRVINWIKLQSPLYMITTFTNSPICLISLDLWFVYEIQSTHRFFLTLFFMDWKILVTIKPWLLLKSTWLVIVSLIFNYYFLNIENWIRGGFIVDFTLFHYYMKDFFFKFKKFIILQKKLIGQCFLYYFQM